MHLLLSSVRSWQWAVLTGPVQAVAEEGEGGGFVGRLFGCAGWADLRTMLGCEASSSLFSFSVFLFLFPFLFYASHMCI